jgi:Zn-finger nucleic acid-binding protein
VIYRDRPYECARCAIELTRDRDLDVYECPRCKGALVSVEYLIGELVRIAPDLVPASRRAVDLTTLERRSTTTPITCTGCHAPMTPIFLGGVEIERCFPDQLMWFDAGERDAVLDRARAQHEERQRPWFVRLFLG